MIMVFKPLFIQSMARDKGRLIREEKKMEEKRKDL